MLYGPSLFLSLIHIYKAFLRSATKGGEALGLSFTDANNQLLSMPEILEQLRGKFASVKLRPRRCV